MKDKTMKSVNLIGNRFDTKTASVLDETPKQREARQSANRIHREKLVDEIIGQVEIVHEYDMQALGRFGFGFLKSDGRLVSYNIPPAGKISAIYDSTEFSETTIAKALEWIEHMTYADTFFGDPMQQGAGYGRWIKMLRDAIK